MSSVSSQSLPQAGMKWVHSVCELMFVSVCRGGEVTEEGDVVGRVPGDAG